MAMRQLKKEAASGFWTLKRVADPKRAPVTKETVKQLSGDRALRGVREVARKYAG